MNATSYKRLLLFCLAVYLLATAFSVYCLTLKRDALGYQPRDYAYFFEQAARLADPGLTNRFAMNIEGYNFLGLQGSEGVKSIYHAIHTEYFRYTYAGIYFLFHTTTAIYIFYCLIFFSPLLYYALISRRSPGGTWQPVVLFTLLYVLFPAVINSVAFEVRPRVLFIPAWCLAVLAIAHGRPFREKLAFFLFLFSIREESILLGAILLAMNFFAMSGKRKLPVGSAKRGLPFGSAKRGWQTVVLLGLDLTAAVAFVAFMAWGGYFAHVDPNFDPLNFVRNLSPLGWAAIAAGLAGLLAGTGWIWRVCPNWLDRWLFALAYGAALALTGLSTYRDTTQWYATQQLVAPLGPWDTFLKIITGAQNSLTFYIALLPLPLLWPLARGAARKALTAAMIVLCIFCAAISVYTVAGQVATWSQAREPARLVWDFKNSIDRYQTNVLVDYDTYQAFYDVEKTIVYQRLPLWMVVPDDRYYPKNKGFLAKLMRDRMEYAVIARGSLADVQELAALAGMPATQVTANEKFVVLKLR